MKRHRHLHALAGLVVLLGAYAANAQVVAVTDTTSTPLPGEGHSYIQSFNETVNPGNGSVSIRLQVPVPPGRGITVPFGFSYDSSGVHFPGGGIGGVAQWGTSASYLSTGGWSYTLPILSFSFGQQTIGSYSCPYYTGYVFEDSQGSRYPMALEYTPTVKNCPNLTRYSHTEGPYQIDTYGGLQIDSPDGTLYSYSVNTGCGPISGSGGIGELPYAIEDRNGNQITFSGPPTRCDGSFTMTDTLGRPSVTSSGYGTTGNTITVAGMSNPYTLSWGTATTDFTVGYTQIGTDTQCRGMGKTQGSYQFLYSDTVSGLLTEIVYPNGGYVKYTWAPTTTYAEYGYFPDAQGSVDCYYQYSPYFLASRTVSYDGSTVALGNL